MSKTKPKTLSRGQTVLLILIILFLLPGILFAAWFGLTYLPVKQDSSFPAREITVSFRADMPAFMVPRKIVQMEELPHLPNGKIAMKSLSETIG